MPGEPETQEIQCEQNELMEAYLYIMTYLIAEITLAFSKLNN